MVSNPVPSDPAPSTGELPVQPPLAPATSLPISGGGNAGTAPPQAGSSGDCATSPSSQPQHPSPPPDPTGPSNLYLGVTACVLAVLMALFFSAAYKQYGALEAEISKGPALQLNDLNQHALGKEPFDWLRFEVVRQGFALNASIHFARAQLLSLLWLKEMGFLAGMVLAFAGAFFILARVHEPLGTRTEAETKIQELTLMVKTSYPGLVLAITGAVLIGLTLFISKPVEWRAGAIAIPKTLRAFDTDGREIQERKDDAVSKEIDKTKDDIKDLGKVIKTLPGGKPGSPPGSSGSAPTPPATARGAGSQ